MKFKLQALGFNLASFRQSGWRRKHNVRRGVEREKQTREERVEEYNPLLTQNVLQAAGFKIRTRIVHAPGAISNGSRKELLQPLGLMKDLATTSIGVPVTTKADHKYLLS
ncbi:unnamed protein product [Clavelina lepadiformis]|uniref:Uncharacterized protein n=1 Tax=Clavelina lepadiformis TaxID=159417 RepID=A0ABP0FK14_CLALP